MKKRRKRYIELKINLTQKEEEEIPEEERRLILKKKMDKLFDPSELQDKF
jgi:hypothetical protein